MNPLKWVRWKVVAVLAILFAVLWLIGVDPLLRWRVNEQGSASPRTRWQVGGIDLGLLAGSLDLDRILVATRDGSRRDGASGLAAPVDPGTELSEERLASADLASFDLSMTELLSRRFVVDTVRVKTPRLRVERRPDGSTNVGDLGGEAPEEPPGERDEDGRRTSTPSEGWVETAKKWYRRLKKIREWAPAESGGRGEEKAPGERFESRRATYPFAGRPGVVVRQVIAEGLEIDFDAESSSGPLPSLRNGSATLRGLSDRPTMHDVPIEAEIQGEFEGAPVSLEAVLDFTKKPASFSVRLAAERVPVPVVEAFVGPSLPVKLSEGALTVEARLALDGDENLLVEPSLRFHNVRLESRDAQGKIAGVDGRQFISAFNEASSRLGDEPLVIADLRITGTLSRPEFEWGDTVRKLVVQGGEAFARSQIEKGVKEIRGRVDEELERSPVGKEIKKTIEGIIPGASGGTEDAAKKGAGKLLDVFGSERDESDKK